MDLSIKNQFELLKYSFHMACLCRDGEIVAINQQGADLLGEDEASLEGRQFIDFISGPYREALAEEITLLAEADEVIPIKLERKDGAVWDVELRMSKTPEIGDDYFIIVARDITQRTRVSEDMKRREEQYRKLVHMALDLICLSDGGEITFLNKAGADLLKIEDANSVVGKPFWELFHPDYELIFKDGIKELVEEETVFPARLACHDGSYLDIEVAITALDGLLANNIMIEARDITEHNSAVKDLHEANKYLEKRVEERTKELMDEVAERRRAQTRLMHIASHDILTDLPNRSLLMDRISMTLSRSDRSQESFSILFIDLDGFKAINDTLGHEAGDNLLIEVSRRLQTSVRDEDTVARIGGDEFVILMAERGTSSGAERVAEGIISALSEPFQLKTDEPAYIGASIGISKFPEHGNDPSSLLKKADNAMYEAKNAGKNTYRVANNSEPK